MSQELLDDVKNTIRAVLTSCDTVLGLTELAKDYKSQDGSDIPYRQLGHSSLLTFLRTIPDTVRLSNPESYSTFVYPVSDSKTAHLSKLVINQKKNTKPKRYRRGPPPPIRRFNSFPSRQIRNLPQEDIITDNFREDALRVLRNHPEGIPSHEFENHVNRVSYNHCLTTPSDEIQNDLAKFTEVEHGRVFLRRINPIVHRNGAVHHEPPRRPSNLDNLEFSASDSQDDSDYDFDAYSHDSSVSDENVAENMSHTKANLTNGNNAEPKSNSIDNMSDNIIPPKVIKNIQTLIQAKENRNGIWLRDLLEKYLLKFNYDLKPEEYGFDDVFEFLTKLKNVVYLKRYRSEGDHLLLDARQVEPVTCEDTGNIPMSFINTLKRILTKRSVGSLCTDDLPVEYQRHTGFTLDPKEFGFSCMDSFLKNLEESCSDFCFRPVKDRILIRLNSTPLDAKSSQNENLPAVLPNGPKLDPFPAEVCNANSKLPPDPLFELLKKDDVFKVELAEVYTPWRFFVHHVNNMLTLDRMMDDLNAFYVENEKEYEVIPFTVVKGLLCACTYSANNKWHRVSVISTKLRTAKVKFVDYGTTEEVNVNKLRYLHRDYARDHAMSVRAKLTCIQPKNIVDPAARSEQSIKLNNLFYQIASSADLEATFINFDAKNDCYEISLRCIPQNDPPFSISDYLYNENLVDIKSVEVVELPTTDATPSIFFTPESLHPAKKTEQRSRSKPVGSETAEKPITSSTPPVAPVVSPPLSQPLPPQKGPPPGLSLPSSAQSQTYETLFSPPLISKSKEASNVRGSQKKIIPKKNTELYGSPLIAQSSMNSPFIPAPVNVPPAYMTGLRCATSFDPLLVPQTLPPFGMAPSMTSSYASPGFSQYASPYFLNYPYQTIPPVPPATPNPFTQFVPHPSPSFVRPPPGFDPLNFPRPPSSASSYCRPGFVPTPLAPCRIGTQYDDRLPPRSSSHEPLVTIASTATTTTNKFEWPLTDPELASQWKKEMVSSLQWTKDPLLNTNPDKNSSEVQGADTSVPDTSTYEDLIAIEKARERRGAESTLKKCFNFSPSSEVIENVLSFLETQAKSPSSDTNKESLLKTATESELKDATAASGISWPAPVVSSPSVPAPELLATDFRLSKSRVLQNEVMQEMNTMLDKLSPPACREADSASSPSQKTSTSAALSDAACACSGPPPTVAKKTSKLDSIKQMVMQKRK